jgi:hypothetical protein
VGSVAVEGREGNEHEIEKGVARINFTAGAKSGFATAWTELSDYSELLVPELGD